MLFPNQTSTHREFRTIQSIESTKPQITKEKLQSNFWGMSLFTLLLTLALLSLLNLHQSSKNKDH